MGMRSTMSPAEALARLFEVRTESPDSSISTFPEEEVASNDR